MPAQSESFQAWYEATLTELCATGYRVRDPIWTECVAVGSQEWLEPLAERVVVGKTAIIPAVESPQVTVGDGAGSYGLSVSRRQSDWLLWPCGEFGTLKCLLCNVFR
jgi:hypothetical protein